MEIFYFPYQLSSASPLNRRTERSLQHGLLIRQGSGFGCLHPWPEYGDAEIDLQLEALRAGHPTALGRRALECCVQDGAARERGASLFAGLEIPPSHAAELGELHAERWLDEGFNYVKWKCPGTLPAAAETIRRLPEALRVRLDFNATLTAKQFLEFADRLGAEGRGRVDFVEDPCPANDPGIDRLGHCGLTIADDWEQYGEIARMRVVKPARAALSALGTKRQIITTVMDHPLGQMWAAWHAAKFGAGEVHGLLTHQLYGRDPFVERLVTDGPRLLPPGGTGLGFDDLLEVLPWKKL